MDAVGVIPIVDVAPIYLGVEQGFFEERGIDLTLESGQGAPRSCPVEPFRTIAMSQGGREIASNLVDTGENVMISSYFTSEQPGTRSGVQSNR
ncbi:MAG: hypothetical protein ACLGIV_01135 [Actinomycetes bacterium]